MGDEEKQGRQGDGWRYWTNTGARPKTANTSSQNSRQVPVRLTEQSRVQYEPRWPRYVQGQQKEGQHITLDTLNRLMFQTPASVASYLSQNYKDLDKSLKDIGGKWSREQILWMRRMVSVLAIAIKHTGEPRNLTSIYGSMQRNLFRGSLMSFLTILAADYATTAQDVLQIVDSALTIMNGIAARTPHMVVTLLGVDVVLSTLLNRHDVVALPKTAELKAIVVELQQDIKDTLMERNLASSDAINSDEEDEATESFRSVNVYPNREELLITQEPYLRKNKVKGAYRSDDDYLDVQFRLLREDFVRPLRQGLAALKASRGDPKASARVDDLRIYPGTKVLRTTFNNDGLGYVIQFNTKTLKHVNWDTSKRLIFGSFLCFSKDDFDTLLFATVSNSKAKELKLGLLEVTFHGDKPDTVDLERDTFVMCETEAFFEAYRHVLRALQSLTTVPFSRHIVKCEIDVAAPKYLQRNCMYDFTPVIDKTSIVQIGVQNDEPLKELPSDDDDEQQTELRPDSKSLPIDIRKLDAWPTADHLGLDSAQYAALQTALTKEFVVIQGPPGTGKTFIGLQIAKALLHNQFRNNFAASPMFVVCFTNHALDQFLGGIIDFLKGKVIRVGGRSSDESMKEHALGEERERMRKNRLIPSQIFHERRNAREAVIRLQEMIFEFEQKIRRLNSLTEYARIETLIQYMGIQYHSLRKGLVDLLFLFPDIQLQQQRVDIIFEWLGIGKYLSNYDFKEIFADEHTHEELNVSKTEETVDKRFEEKLIQVQDTAQAVESERILDDLDADLPVRHQAKRQATEGNSGIITSEHHGWQLASRKKKIRFETLTPLTANEARRIQEVWELSHEQRWRLYRYWVNCYLEFLETQKTTLHEHYQQSVAEYKRARMREDAYILKQANVIGMTTTGAARCQELMKKVGPRVIIVEEAAEVLEAHVIATLSETCEHLLLIGDHQQLRPNPTCYTLAKQYKLDISLFERMIDNGVESTCLREQRRMRPEISRLLRHIYPDLMDHECVTKYDHIKGVSSDVFFISHSVNESHDKEQKSHLNEHEAHYIVALCNYLIQQGYAREQITVLTTYSAQLFYLRSLMPESEFEGVTVTVVDNYQGEENDIILLSLVRSNDDGKIGFLKVHNRMCVALSRAKKGFYVIGNFEFLRNNSQLWDKMVGTLLEQNQIGASMGLFCQNHKDDGFQAEFAADFLKAPDGGCKRKCDTRLKCGHVCTRYCHSYDADHREFKCLKACRGCARGHSCPKICYEDCNCMVPVVHEMPKCGHSQTMPCLYDPNVWQCQKPCETILPCGHLCQALCGKEHLCEVPVERTLPCGHEITVPCNTDMDNFECPCLCEKDHGCGHKCKEICHSPKVVKICNESVVSELPCCHKVTHACHKTVQRRDCKYPCSKTLPCGHLCTNHCGEDHIRICEVPTIRKVPACGHEAKVYCGTDIDAFKCTEQVSKPFPCGHLWEVDCHLQDTAKCTKPCRVKLHCGHKCRGSCSSCDESRFHQPCIQCGYCDATFVCGHTCRGYPNTSFPCSEPCMRQCPHKKCLKYCYQPCEHGNDSYVWPCSSDCSWKCPHYVCTKMCGEVCDRPPCDERCPKRLPCGHECIGLCGEPCPALCRTCRKDQVTTIHFGREAEPDARFVYLENCGHIVEVSAMDAWMAKWSHTESLRDVQLPICPLCRARIPCIPRYQKTFKQAELDIETVKHLAWEVAPDLHKRKTRDMCDELYNATSSIEDRAFKNETRIRIESLEARLEEEPRVFSTQMLIDVSLELQRICLMMKVQLVREHLQQDKVTPSDVIQQMENSLSRGRLTTPAIETAMDCLRQYDGIFPKRLMHNFHLSDEQLTEVLSLGSWKVCSEGHLIRAGTASRGHCPICRKDKTSGKHEISPEAKASTQAPPSLKARPAYKKKSSRPDWRRGKKLFLS